MLRDVTEKVLLKKRLWRQNQDLSAVNSISKTLSSSIDPEEVLQNTLVQVLQIMKIEMGLITSWTRRRRRSAAPCPMASRTKLSRREGLKVGEGIAGMGRCQRFSAHHRERVHHSRIQSLAFRQQGIRSFASIPIQSGPGSSVS
jgi:hypothetical protein